MHVPFKTSEAGNVAENDTYQTLKSFIEEDLLDGGRVDDGARLFSDGSIDSMNLIQLLGFLEQEFQVKVPTSSVNVQSLDTVASITKLVDGLRA